MAHPERRLRQLEHFKSEISEHDNLQLSKPAPAAVGVFDFMLRM
ncbi:unnamed protein product [Ciceribacter sp. T2.26MG-112.2]|nr:unnamed protein product [Ciceribacter naphthalenivorans]